MAAAYASAPPYRRYRRLRSRPPAWLRPYRTGPGLPATEANAESSSSSVPTIRRRSSTTSSRSAAAFSNSSAYAAAFICVSSSLIMRRISSLGMSFAASALS